MGHRLMSKVPDHPIEPSGASCFHGAKQIPVAVTNVYAHPFGVFLLEPIVQDHSVGRVFGLKDALALLDIRLLDHFVVGDGAPVSMASRGMV